MILRSILLIYSFIGIGSTIGHSQEWIADSLIQKLESAQEGYDQIDYCLGIARSYMIARNADQFRKYIDRAWILSEKSNDKAGRAQAKVFYNLLERNFSGNMTEAANHSKEAYEIALESKDMDALTFAVYQYSEVLGNYQKKNDEAIQLLKSHLTKIDETTTLKNKANFYKSYGHALSRDGKEQEAIQYYLQALSILETIISNPDVQYRLGRVSALYADKGIINTSVTKNELAMAYARSGNLSKAIQLSHENLDLVTDYNNSDYIAWISSNLGKLYKQKGDYETAIQYFNNATLIWEKDPTAAKDVASLKVPLGEIYTELEDYNTALTYFQNRMDYAITHQDTTGYLEGLILKVDCLNKQNKYEEAYDEIVNAEFISSTYGALEVAADIKIKKSETLYHMGETPKAISLIKEAYDIFEKTANNSRFPELLKMQANYYLKLGQTEKGIDILNQSVSLSQEYNQGDDLSTAYYELSQAYKSEGNYELAFSNFELFHNNENNLLSSDAQKILREEQVRQNVNQFIEEKEVATERAALLQTQNKLYIGLAVLLSAFLLMGTYLYNQIRKSRFIIQKRNKELADLNTTKDKFFSIIAHDIRSPLLALGGVGEQMEYYVEKGKVDKMKGLSKKISNTANHVSSLLDNLLNWALLQRGVLPHKPESISLEEIVKESISMFTLHAELKDIALINEVDEGIHINADIAAVKTIIRNLLSNAVKFTPKGGQIVIKSDITPHNVAIHVTDNGIGMEAEKAERVFRLEPNRDAGTEGEKGTGLGLMLCKELVELNDGSISVTTSKGQGTTFSIELPKAA